MICFMSIVVYKHNLFFLFEDFCETSQWSANLNMPLTEKNRWFQIFLIKKVFQKIRKLGKHVFWKYLLWCSSITAQKSAEIELRMCCMGTDKVQKLIPAVFSEHFKQILVRGLVVASLDSFASFFCCHSKTIGKAETFKIEWFLAKQK